MDDLKDYYSDSHDTVSKFIIYAGTIQKTREIAEFLRCPAYFSTSGNTIQKKEVLTGFLTGSLRIIAATSALGLGLNIPNIRAVIHVGILRNLRDYIQESGQAGRDHQPAQAIILRDRNDRFQDENMTDYLTKTQCRRIIINEVLDGNFTTQNCGAQAKCDYCEFYLENSQDSRPQTPEDRFPGSGSPELPHSAVILPIQSPQNIQFSRILQNQRLSQEIAENQEIETGLHPAEITAKLARWRGRCSVCFHKQTGDDDHFLTRCSDPDSQIIREFIGFFRRFQTIPSYSGCYNCYLPYEICQRYEMDENNYFQVQPGRQCQFHRVLLDVISVLGFFHDESRISWLQRRAQLYNISLDFAGRPEDLFPGLVRLFCSKIQSFHVESLEIVLFFQNFG